MPNNLNRDLIKYNKIKDDYENNFMTLDEAIKNLNIKSRQTYYNICKRLKKPSIVIISNIPCINTPPPYDNSIFTKTKNQNPTIFGGSSTIDNIKKKKDKVLDDQKKKY